MNKKKKMRRVTRTRALANMYCERHGRYFTNREGLDCEDCRHKIRCGLQNIE